MASIYQSDLEERFPAYTVTITTDGSLTICTVTATIGGAVIARARASSENDAVAAARRNLGVRDNVLCMLTTTQRNALASPATGVLICNITDLQVQFYNGSAWQAV